MADVDQFFGIDIAFKDDFLANQTGDIDKITGLQNVKDSLVRRTITEPGTMIHRPEYGVGLKRFVNALNSLDNRRELANRIKYQWERDERVDEVISVSVDSEDDNPERVTIAVRVRLIGYGEAQVNVIGFNERVD